MTHSRFIQIYSAVGMGTGIFSFFHDTSLLFGMQSHLFDLAVNFLFIFLFFLSVLAIGMYHFWHEKHTLFYLPRFFLGMFFVGLIGSILLLNIEVTALVGYTLTLCSLLFAVALIVFGWHSFSQINKMPSS